MSAVECDGPKRLAVPRGTQYRKRGHVENGATRSIYDFPEIFRAVQFELPGEIEAETAFISQVFARHLGRRVRRVLDIACGTSPHGQLLAAQGIEVVGIDRSPVMIGLGRRQVGARRNPRFYRRQVERFSLPEHNFDAAYLYSETFPILVDNRDVIDHLRSVARVLRPGALYCVDIDRHDGIEHLRGRRPWRQREVRCQGVRVEVREFKRPIAWDAAAWIYEVQCRIHFPKGKPVLTRDLIPVRYTVPKLLELAASAAGVFKLIACYPDLSLEGSMAQCDRRWCGVLRRI